MYPKKKIAQKLKERTVESFLDLLILNKLAKTSSKNADDLKGCISRKFKVSVSSGILYSHLHHLERHKLILKENIKDSKVYRITPMGKKKIAAARKNRDVFQWIIDQVLEG